jgi:signal peptidase I
MIINYRAALRFDPVYFRIATSNFNLTSARSRYHHRLFSAAKRINYNPRKSKIKANLQERVSHPNKTNNGSNVVPQSKHWSHLREFFYPNNWLRRFQHSFPPIAYKSGDDREQWICYIQRFSLWLILAWMISSDDTFPCKLIFINGPSMIPTMAADGSEIWICSNMKFWNMFGMNTSFARGDLIGFSHPTYPKHISCKRVIGVPGDSVQRFGQYVHLYVAQDPSGWGIIWPDATDPSHQWLQESRQWNETQDATLKSTRDIKHTIMVPNNQVWIEADCPALGIDSRHFGSIPLQWVRGKIIFRMWPLWRSGRSINSRPHPIPLDKETLAGYNVVFNDKPSKRHLPR